MACCATRGLIDTFGEIHRFFLDRTHAVRHLAGMKTGSVWPLCVFGLSLVAWLAPPPASAHQSSSAMPVQIVPLGAFHPDGDTAGGTSPSAPATQHVVTAFQPAPMPDPDIDPPHGSAARGPSLTPALFSHKAEFDGDGYAVNSDPDHGLDHRRTPAAGLNWSLPVR